MANAATFGRTSPHLRRGRIATSFALALRVDGTAAKTAHNFSARRVERQRQRRRLGLSAVSERAKAWSWNPGQPPSMGDWPAPPTGATAGARDAEVQVSSQAAIADQGKIKHPEGAGPVADGHGWEKQPNVDQVTRELQYLDCVEVKNRHGLTSLGLMTNQVWHDDPRRLTFLLARYKFVAKMLSGQSAVAEVGCGDAFGTRVVMQEVDRVDVYDFDPVFIEDIRQRQSQRWQMTATVHDIVLAALPHSYDGILQPRRH